MDDSTQMPGVSTPETLSLEPRSTISIPSRGTLIFVITLFLGAIGIQTYDLVQRETLWEARRNTEFAIREFENSRGSFQEQNQGWMALTSERRNEQQSLESEIIVLRENIKALRSDRTKAQSELEATIQQQQSTTSEFEKLKVSLAEQQAEMQTSKARSRAIETAIADLQKQYAAKKAEKDSLLLEVDELAKKTATLDAQVQLQKTSLETQLEAILALNRTQSEIDLLGKSKQLIQSELTTLETEKESILRTLTGLKGEVARLSESEKNSKETIAKYEAQTIALADQIKTLETTRDELQKAVEKLRDEVKPSEEDQ